ncbi:hypothetical protein [Chitinophaga sp. OAE865]|uniref:hypothetical protein n=1 Tax=Chitinophaga sp. OAE865 TaxID=2817898 RepID=UPI001AEB6DB3
MWIDFAVHSDKGLASYRAQQATKGEVLGAAMKESSRPLFPRADKYRLVDLRNYFKTEKAWLPGEYAATAHWQSGSSEDQ